jgi:hypothetical protein
MAFTQHGDQDYVFGFQDAGAAAIAAAAGVKPQTLSISYEPEFQAEATNEEGQIAAKVIGPDKGTFTLSGYLVDDSAFGSATNFTYDGKFFIITGRKTDASNQDFVKAELTGEYYPLITS